MFVFAVKNINLWKFYIIWFLLHDGHTRSLKIRNDLFSDPTMTSWQNREKSFLHKIQFNYFNDFIFHHFIVMHLFRTLAGKFLFPKLMLILWFHLSFFIYALANGRSRSRATLLKRKNRSFITAWHQRRRIRIEINFHQ